MDQEVINLSEWLNKLRQYEVEWDRILIAVLVFLFFLLLRKVFTKYILKLLTLLTERTSNNFDDYLVEACKKPMRTLFVLLGIYLGLKAIQFEPEIYDVMDRFYRTIIIILIAWGVFNLTGRSSLWIESLGQRFRFEVDKILLPLLSKAIRIVIIALAFTVIAQEWGYEITGFIAGLGLGGLAFALAAQDVLKNIFGGVVIIAEKPFSIGDWIETPSVEGTVEDITFRSTRVRTFAQALVVVPNSTLANQAITNWTKMGKRRITFQLGVTYTTPRHKLEAVVEAIKSMLEQHEEIDQDTLFVRFDSFATSSLDIFLYFFTKTTNWGEYLRIKEDCNLKIMEILEREGVSMAFPSTSVYFETPLRQEDDKA